MIKINKQILKFFIKDLFYNIYLSQILLNLKNKMFWLQLVAISLNINCNKKNYFIYCNKNTININNYKIEYTNTHYLKNIYIYLNSLDICKKF